MSFFRGTGSTRRPRGRRPQRFPNAEGDDERLYTDSLHLGEPQQGYLDPFTGEQTPFVLQRQPQPPQPDFSFAERGRQPMDEEQMGPQPPQRPKQPGMAFDLQPPRAVAPAVAPRPSPFSLAGGIGGGAAALGLPSLAGERQQSVARESENLLRDRSFLEGYLRQNNGPDLERARSFDYGADQGFLAQVRTEAESRYRQQQPTIDPTGRFRLQETANLSRALVNDPAFRAKYQGLDPGTGLPVGFDPNTNPLVRAAAQQRAGELFDLRQALPNAPALYGEQWTMVRAGGAGGPGGSVDPTIPEGFELWQDERGNQVLLDLSTGRMTRR